MTRPSLSPVYIRQLRLLYSRIEETIGTEAAEKVWQSISWKPDAAQRLLELAHLQVNGALTQPEYAELERLIADPATAEAPGPDGAVWQLRANREVRAFYNQLRLRYGEKIARKQFQKALDREANRPAMESLDAAMLSIKSFFKSCGVRAYQKRTAELLSRVLQIDLRSATRRLEKASALRRKRKIPSEPLSLQREKKTRIFDTLEPFAAEPVDESGDQRKAAFD